MAPLVETIFQLVASRLAFPCIAYYFIVVFGSYCIAFVRSCIRTFAYS